MDSEPLINQNLPCFELIWIIEYNVTSILKQNNVFYFLNQKIWKIVKFDLNFNFYTNHTVIFFSQGQIILNDMDNKWCEGKYSPTIGLNKVYTNEKPLRLMNSEVFKIHVAIKNIIAHLGNVADLGNWSGLTTTAIMNLCVRVIIRTRWNYIVQYWENEKHL